MLLTIDLLLADSCPSGQYVNDDCELVFKTTINLHCVSYEIEYIKLVDGKYNQDTMTWDTPPLYHVLSAVKKIA